MDVHSGETAYMTGDFRCESCHTKVHFTNGQEIPKCPNCGNDTFVSGSDEPENY